MKAALRVLPTTLVAVAALVAPSAAAAAPASTSFAIVGSSTPSPPPYHGGTITTLNAGAKCTNQQYRVSDGLENVRTSTTSGGSGSFVVMLTHYRYSLFGHCVIYKARVSGALSVSY